MRKNLFFVLLVGLAVLGGCKTMGDQQEYENAPVTVKRFVDSHNAVMRELSEIKAISKETVTSQKPRARMRWDGCRNDVVTRRAPV